MKRTAFVGIFFVGVITVVANLVVNPQMLDRAQMQTMYGGTQCWSKNETFTTGCEPTWTCSADKPEAGTDYTSLGTQHKYEVNSGYFSYSETTNGDHTCKVTSFAPRTQQNNTCSQRLISESYWYGTLYSPVGEPNCWNP